MGVMAKPDRGAAPSGARYLQSSNDASVQTSRALVRRQTVVPLAQHPERRPEPLLGVLGVERGVDVGHVQRVDGGREALHLALAGLDLVGERQLEVVEDPE